MLNVDFLNIDNDKMIGRLLPFWARGRKISLLLQALLYPLRYVHQKFKVWALERYIESHISGQKMSLEWYLKYMLKTHLVDEKQEFFITQEAQELITSLSSNNWDNYSFWDNEQPWMNGYVVIAPELADIINHCTIVYAPPIVETIDYDYSDYERDIRFIISKYMINFSKVFIIFATN